MGAHPRGRKGRGRGLWRRRGPSRSRPGRVRVGRGGARGFTLLELLVVITVLAVLGGMAVPALRPPPEPIGVDAGAGQVEALFRLARAEAIRQGVEVMVILDSATARVWVDRAPGGDPSGRASMEVRGDAGAGEAGAPDPGTRLLREALAPGRGGGDLELPRGVQLLLPRARMTFHFHPAGGARGEPVLLQGPGGERWVVLDPWSGHASVR